MNGSDDEFSRELPPAMPLRQVIAQHPALEGWGWGLGPGPGHEINREQFRSACSYLRAMTRPSARFNTREGSYWLKHLAETWAGEYISNGALIAAALSLGYQYRRRSQRGPYCVFNLQLRHAPAIGPALRAGQLPGWVAMGVAHRAAVEIGVPFYRLWHALPSAMDQGPCDGTELAQRLDRMLGLPFGATLGALGNAIQFEASK